MLQEDIIKISRSHKIIKMLLMNIYIQYKKNISIKKLIKKKSTIIDQLIKNSWAKII